MKIKNKIKRRTYILVTFLLIFFMSIFSLYFYTTKVNDSLIIVTEQTFQNEIYTVIESSLKYLIAQEDFGDILKIYKNNAGEILYVDYDLPESYKYLEKISESIKKSFNKDNAIILKFPFMVGSSNILFNNFGPKITVKINYINAILTNINTKITNYGLNNALVEAYVKISIEGLITTPVSERKNIVNYDLLISSKVINGRVPSLYGDNITSNSSIKNIPL